MSSKFMHFFLGYSIEKVVSYNPTMSSQRVFLVMHSYKSHVCLNDHAVAPLKHRCSYQSVSSLHLHSDE